MPTNHLSPEPGRPIEKHIEAESNECDRRALEAADR